jgi:hypothetical protein
MTAAHYLPKEQHIREEVVEGSLAGQDHVGHRRNGILVVVRQEVYESAVAIPDGVRVDLLELISRSASVCAKK